MGKTTRMTVPVSGLEKHPHARGEDGRKAFLIRAEEETPPRTWGRRPQGLPHQGRRGNTPTHVGKTYGTSYYMLCKEKHPHARGEDGRKAACMDYREETPPRTWGRLMIPAGEGGRLGNTPTHVGKTPDTVPFLNIKRETPPRTWGRPFWWHMGADTGRNTPTHVGKTI